MTVNVDVIIINIKINDFRQQELNFSQKSNV